jgi:hypothetical protein
MHVLPCLEFTVGITIKAVVKPTSLLTLGLRVCLLPAILLQRSFSSPPFTWKSKPGIIHGTNPVLLYDFRETSPLPCHTQIRPPTLCKCSSGQASPFLGRFIGVVCRLDSATCGPEWCVTYNYVVLGHWVSSHMIRVAGSARLPVHS